MNDCCDSKHPDHSDEIKRLNRISGQINGIVKMIEDRRYCPDILVQLKAVQSAAKSVEANIMQRHLEGCVREGIASEDKEIANAKIEELIEIFKRN